MNSKSKNMILILSFKDAIIIAQLVEQGLLDYNERISNYWPEFAQGNKENVTLGDLVRNIIFFLLVKNEY